jgi:hypothetical protein
LAGFKLLPFDGATTEVGASVILTSSSPELSLDEDESLSDESGVAIDLVETGFTAAGFLSESLSESESESDDDIFDEALGFDTVVTVVTFGSSSSDSDDEESAFFDTGAALTCTAFGFSSSEDDSSLESLSLTLGATLTVVGFTFCCSSEEEESVSSLSDFLAF